MKGVDYDGLTYRLLHWDNEGHRGWQTDTGSPQALVLLFALQEGVRISPWGDRLLHYGQTATPMTMRRTVASVKAFVHRLRQAGERFVFVWHVSGQPRVHLDHSPTMQPEELRAHIESLLDEAAADGQ